MYTYNPFVVFVFFCLLVKKELVRVFIIYKEAKLFKTFWIP